MNIIYKGSKLYSRLGVIFYKSARPLIDLAFGIYGSERSRVVIYNKNSKEILLLKNWLNSGRYQLPGGGIKLSETPQQGAARELKEELGLKLDPKEFKLIKKIKGSNYTKVFLICEISSPLFSKEALQIAQHEITEVVSIKLKHLDELKLKLDDDSFDLLKNLKIS